MVMEETQKKLPVRNLFAILISIHLLEANDRGEGILINEIVIPN